MKIFFVHHALREKNNIQSQGDGIQKLGKKDAKTVGEIFKLGAENFNYKAIYTSPFKRCKKTAEIINKKLNVPIFEEPRFNEFGSVFETLKEDEKRKETWLNCQLRIRDAIKDIVNNHDEKDTVICVTSGVNITAFIGLAYKIKPSESLPFPIVLSCSPICFNIDKNCF